jgi:uncharacterized membrane protein YcjF (UPF0283 family)
MMPVRSHPVTDAERQSEAARTTTWRWWTTATCYGVAAAGAALTMAWLVGWLLEGWDRRMVFAVRVFIVLGLPVAAGLAWRPLASLVSHRFVRRR